MYKKPFFNIKLSKKTMIKERVTKLVIVIFGIKIIKKKKVEVNSNTHFVFHLIIPLKIKIIMCNF